MRVLPSSPSLLFASSGAALAQGGPGGPPAVGVVAAKRTSVIEETEFVGRVQAINRVDLMARVTGFIEKRFVVEGPKSRPASCSISWSGARRNAGRGAGGDRHPG